MSQIRVFQSTPVGCYHCQVGSHKALDCNKSLGLPWINVSMGTCFLST
uniref:Uncharacterized protein n=1 Tax=Rhizophora mucronata TaxID=61149 RepID=A0A2P2R3L6_RHIMU